MQKKIFHFDKYMCVGKTLNLDSCSKFGEILREFGKVLGKYRILDGRPPGSIGLIRSCSLLVFWPFSNLNLYLL